MMNIKLKPCPFCGADAELCETEGTDYIITCSGDCNSQMFDSMDWYSEDKDLKQELIDNWNKRVEK